jgi:hypothetical protein
VSRRLHNQCLELSKSEMRWGRAEGVKWEQLLTAKMILEFPDCALCGDWILGATGRRPVQRAECGRAKTDESTDCPDKCGEMMAFDNHAALKKLLPKNINQIFPNVNFIAPSVNDKPSYTSEFVGTW